MRSKSTRLRRWMLGIAVTLLAAVAAIKLNDYYQERAQRMLPPLVFLIPETYFGPVFLFFGQPDGVDAIADPLGLAVKVPENGVVKARFDHTVVATGAASPTWRPVWYVIVGQDGSRRIATVSAGLYRNDQGNMETAYLDGFGRLQEYVYSNNPQDPRSKTYYFFSPEKKRERMIFNRDGCTHQGFNKNVGRQGAGEITAQEAGAPACEKFMVISPQEYLDSPDWLWDSLQGTYPSIPSFVEDANEVLEKKKSHYGFS